MTTPTEDEDLYGVTYSIKHHPKGLHRDKITEDMGACDAVLLASIIRQPDGGASYLFVSVDQDGGTILNAELFNVWVGLTHKLAQELPEDGFGKDLCQETLARVREAVAPGATPIDLEVPLEVAVGKAKEGDE